MGSIRRIFTLAFALLVFLSLLVSRAQAQTKKDDDATAIQQLVDGFMADFNRHDAQSIAKWFSEDSDYTNGGGITTHSQQGIEEHYVTLFSGSLKTASRRDISVKNLKFLTPEIASVDVYYELGGSTLQDGSLGPFRKGLYNWTLVKQNGHWLIAVLHEIGIEGGAPPTPRSGQ